MEVHLTNPDLEAKLDRWVSETGRSANELVEDVTACYFDEVAEVRQILDKRYDEIESGKVQLIDGQEAFGRLRAKSEQRRASRA